MGQYNCKSLPECESGPLKGSSIEASAALRTASDYSTLSNFVTAVRVFVRLSTEAVGSSCSVATPRYALLVAAIDRIHEWVLAVHVGFGLASECGEHVNKHEYRYESDGCAKPAPNRIRRILGFLAAEVKSSAVPASRHQARVVRLRGCSLPTARHLRAGHLPH